MDVTENDEVQNRCHSASSLLPQSLAIRMKENACNINHIPQNVNSRSYSETSAECTGQDEELGDRYKLSILQKKIRGLSPDNQNLREEPKGNCNQLYKEKNSHPPQDSHLMTNTLVLQVDNAI